MVAAGTAVMTLFFVVVVSPGEGSLSAVFTEHFMLHRVEALAPFIGSDLNLEAHLGLRLGSLSPPPKSRPNKKDR